MLILWREHHSSAICQVLHKTWAALIMLNTSSWIFLKKLPVEAYSWCAGNDFKKISLHMHRYSTYCFAKSVKVESPYTAAARTRLCSTRKNRNWCKRKGSYRNIKAAFSFAPPSILSLTIYRFVLGEIIPYPITESNPPFYIRSDYPDRQGTSSIFSQRTRKNLHS